jgi:hypothetical protein
MTEKRIITPTGFLKVLITIDDTAASSSLAFIRTGVEIFQEGSSFYENISLRVGEERVVALREGVYKVRAFLGKLESDWTNTEIKTGELTSRIFHFGRESTK